MTEQPAPTDALMADRGRVSIPEYRTSAAAPREGGHYFAGSLALDGTLVAVDAAGADRDEWTASVGALLWDATCWAGSKDVETRLRDAVAGAARGEIRELEIDVPPRAGCEARVIDLAIHPCRNAVGRVVTLLAVARDLSARKAAEAELARRSDRLQTLYENIRELDVLKMQFFANVSHELRTPLALILGSSERLITDVDRASETRHNAEVVARNARLLLRHVNDLLDVAKLEARKMQVQHESVDLAQLVRDTAEHFDALARERRIAYVIDTPESLDAELDAGKIQRVLLNILSNAFKFTPPGGSIRVILGRGPRNSGARPTAGEGRRMAVISVLDSGAGIPADQREAIFERFRQGVVGTTQRFGGTGLGLAIAKDFVELHGGTIAAEDAAGGGAAFVVELPLVATRQAGGRPPTPQEPAVAIDMVSQTIDELRASPPPQTGGSRKRGRGAVPPDQIG